MFSLKNSFLGFITEKGGTSLMEVFKYLGKYGYEELVFLHEEVSGLKGIIAIHNTTLGPALGGTRIWTYDSEVDAVIDALRLARGMTYKSACAGLDLGGGKSVIMADAKKDKTEELLRAFGRYVETLGGRYICAEDVGTTVEDMEIISQETEFVVGVPESQGGSGNPSPVTAYGVYKGIKACADEVFGGDSLKGKVVAVQGLGSVGYGVCRHLHEEGARLFVTDIDQERVEKAAAEFNAEVVAPDKIYDVDCDIFSPCALGGVINDDTLGRLKCRVVAGAANNQLLAEEHGDKLNEMKILYAPDYVINAGGVINVAEEIKGYNRERAMRKAADIYNTVKKVITIAKKEGIPTYKAADRLAEDRIEKMAQIKRNYNPYA